MDLEALPSVIDEARLMENVAAQSTVVETCLQRILDHTAPGSLRKPHPEQVRALRRLIFGKGDTLLVRPHEIRKEHHLPYLFYPNEKDYSSDHSFEPTW
jgi:hypothetical protein